MQSTGKCPVKERWHGGVPVASQNENSIPGLIPTIEMDRAQVGRIALVESGQDEEFLSGRNCPILENTQVYTGSKY